MSVERDYAIKDLSFTDTFALPETQTGTSGGSTGGNALLQGSISRTSTTFGRTATVKAGEDIRPAIESLRAAGGGTLVLLAGTHRPTYNIIGSSKINIVGEGVGQTIIDFGAGSYQISFPGTSGSVLNAFSVKNLTVQNSAIDALSFVYCKDFFIDTVVATLNTGDGFYFNNCEYGFVQNSTSSNNGAAGWNIDGNGLTEVSTRITFLACGAKENTTDGFLIPASYSTYLFLASCVSESNTRHGFNQTSVGTNTRVVFFACTAISNTSNGFEISGNFNRMISCYITGNSDGYNIDGSLNLIVGGDNGDAISLSNYGTVISGNIYDSPEDNNEILNVQNGSGGSLTAGSVVVYKATANADNVTTTTTVGDDKVCGVFLGGLAGISVADGVTGFMQTKGKTAILKVNGTTDIAVGDFLCTYSEAGIAAKAAAGDMTFAIALEAYTGNDSNGVIDALLITPRKL